MCFKADTNEATQLKVSTFGLSGVDDSWMNSIEYICILNDESAWVWMNYRQPSSIFLYSNVDDSLTTPATGFFHLLSVWI
jgi:hypothetical protein